MLLKFVRTCSNYLKLSQIETEFIHFMSDPDNPKPEGHLIGSSQADWNKHLGGDDVLQLTDLNFESFISSNQYTLVLFYTPWCPHCKKMIPEYAAAAKDLKRYGHARLSAIDCSVQAESQKKYEVQGYPSIQLFRYGKLVDTFQGERTKESFVTYMKQKNKAYEL